MGLPQVGVAPAQTPAQKEFDRIHGLLDQFESRLGEVLHMPNPASEANGTGVKLFDGLVSVGNRLEEILGRLAL